MRIESSDSREELQGPAQQYLAAAIGAPRPRAIVRNKAHPDSHCKGDRPCSPRHGQPKRVINRLAPMDQPEQTHRRMDDVTAPGLNGRRYPVLHPLGRFMPAILQACFT